MATTYTAYDTTTEYGREEGVTLKAKTDRSARQEAAKVAKEQGWEGYGIRFFRESDGCSGDIDI